MQNYIKTERDKYKHLKKYRRITADKYCEIHRLILELLILMRFFDSHDISFDEDDLIALLDKVIDELYICSIEYKKITASGETFEKNNDN